jgi:ribosome-associated protein
VAANAAVDKKAEEPIVLDVGEIMGIVGTFVIVSGTNTRQVRTIADAVEEEVKVLLGESPKAVEGLRDASWILLDYGDVVVHVFLDETREFYKLERLWSDAPRVDWERESA